MIDIVDKLEDLAFWVMVPTVRLTENHPSKAVRVLGVLCVFPLFPLIFIGAPIIMLCVLMMMYEDI